MSPIVQGTKDPDRATWSWVHIEDFTPGLYDADNLSTSTPVVEAPLGAANPVGTWSCMALASGGLGPLPRMAQHQAFTPAFPASVTNVYLVGALMVPHAAGAVNQLLVMYEGDNGTNHYYRVYAFNPTTTTFTLIHTITAATQAGIFGSPYPQLTRARLATFTKAGTPIAVWPAALTHDSHGNAGHVFVWPTPTHRTTFTDIKDLVTPTVQIAGQLITLFNRIIVLSGITYSWPGGGFITNENVAFTTPPNSLTLGNQQEVFAAEDPTGYGCAGSISTGEMILVKKLGGGVVVNGDVEAPSSVLYLPGIHPTGNFYGRPAEAEAGLYYASEHQGAWLWNGGNVSQKISSQLRDDFFDVETGVIASNNFGFYAERWGTWIAWSGNWLYNEQQGSWWRLYPTATTSDTGATAGNTFFWWLPGAFGYDFYGLPLKIAHNAPFLYRFDNRYSAPVYKWTSLPIHVAPTANHRIDVREVVIRASCPVAGSFVKVQIGTWTATSSEPIGTTPSIIRFHVGVGALGLQDIELVLHGHALHDTTQTLQAPLIHSVDIAYAIRAHEEADN